MRNTEKTLIDVYNKALVTRAKYIAMDSDGVVYGYEEEPIKSGSYWWWAGVDSKYVYLGTVDVGGLDWRHTMLEVWTPSYDRDVRTLEEVRTMGRPNEANAPAFDLEEALADAPVKLRGGGKAYIRFFERVYETDYPVVGVLVVGSLTMIALWRECGRYLDASTESPCDIVGMWVEPKLINGHEVPDISFTPNTGERYYFPEPNKPSLYASSWFFSSDEYGVHRLKNNMCYPYTDEGKAAAIAHAKAMLGDQCE